MRLYPRRRKRSDEECFHLPTPVEATPLQERFDWKRTPPVGDDSAPESFFTSPTLRRKRREATLPSLKHILRMIWVSGECMLQRCNTCNNTMTLTQKALNSDFLVRPPLLQSQPAFPFLPSSSRTLQSTRKESFPLRSTYCRHPGSL